MKRGGYGINFMFLAVALLLFVPGLSMGDVLENMRFDPLPQVGDTTVSGTCDQSEGQIEGCDGPVEVVIAVGGVPGENVEVLGEGTCEGGRFSITLCSPFSFGDVLPNPPCSPYALQRGDVISGGQFLHGAGGTLSQPLQPENLCDSTPWFTVGAGIPTISEWGMIALSFLLALSAIVLIRRRRKA